MTKKEKDMETTLDQTQEQLFREAQKRVRFKIHFILFILANFLIWILWFFIFSKLNDLPQREMALNTFLFITLVWLICVIAHYLFVYKWTKSYVEKEVEMLKKEQDKKLKELAKLKEDANKQQL
ncbi:MAG: 2TM domain-containing protein [Bacteroidales bacterium]|jgi:Na+/melibiose symporter-like transporter|nr:2TM domain-containing protein [Bacteroidales bacterium]